MFLAAITNISDKMPINWISNDHKRLYHYALSLGVEGNKTRWAEASEVAATYSSNWAKMEMKNAQSTRAKDPDCLKVGWCNETEHTKFLTGLSGIPRAVAGLSRSNVQALGSTLGSHNISSSNASQSARSSSTPDHEFNQLAIRQLQKIALALGSLPDISEKLGTLCSHLKIKQEKRKFSYADAVMTAKKEKHEEMKGVVAVSDAEDEEEDAEDAEDEDAEDDAEDDDEEDAEDEDESDKEGDDDEKDNDNVGDTASATNAFLTDEALADARAKVNDGKRSKDREKSKTKAANKAAEKAALKEAKAAAKAAEKEANAAGRKAAAAKKKSADVKKTSSGRTVKLSEKAAAADDK